MIRFLFFAVLFIATSFPVAAQIFINEGSNKNYSLLLDEELEAQDWIELYNAGTDTIDLEGYSLTDDPNAPAKWIFPSYLFAPGDFLLVFCSDKNRFPINAFTSIASFQAFTPEIGWNVHNFETPFDWDGVSNLVLNVCSYNAQGYTNNSLFRLQETDYPSTIAKWEDGSSAACIALAGETYYARPVMQINGFSLGEGSYSNGFDNYPAPYGNWYWCARHQIMLRAEELQAAGVTAGVLTSLAFEVDSTLFETYTQLDFALNQVPQSELTNYFLNINGASFHTNFKISDAGETIYLYTPDQTLQSSLWVEVPMLDVSCGLQVDGGTAVRLFDTPTPDSSNNFANWGNQVLLSPVLTPSAEVFEDSVVVVITHENEASGTIYYTLDGSEPSIANGLIYSAPLLITENQVIKAKVLATGFVASPSAIGSYLLDILHSTPIISVVAAPKSIYGAWGMFDNPFTDWERAGYLHYFSDSASHPLMLAQRTGLRMDGGAGGSRSNPQRSFRLSLFDKKFGDGAIELPSLFADKPNRNSFSKLYLRNGSNQWLTLPHKDAMQVRMMSDSTYNYYSAMRPVSVYVNGAYNGLYELREKFDSEYFQLLEGADPDLIDLLSISYYYNGAFRAIEGSVDNFWIDHDAFMLLDPADQGFWEAADTHFDLQYYTDYIAAQTWMGNTDWPQNNIKIYRSDKTDFRWRFCLIDLELSLAPNGWTDCNFNMLEYLTNESSYNTFGQIWAQSIQNNRYRDYFINRYADLMNSNYKTSRLTQIANNYYNAMVPEWINEHQRWGDQNTSDQAALDYFTSNQDQFLTDIACRTEQVRQHIQSRFELQQLSQITLDVVPENAGTIEISTLDITQFPWEGIYFDGLPVGISAVAKGGYAFSHWQPNAVITDTLNPVFLDTLTQNQLAFVAVFKPWTTTQETPYISNWKIYPSPADQEIRLAHGFLNAETAQYSISDVSGRIVAQGVLQTTEIASRVSVSGLSSGVYVVELSAPSGVYKPLIFVKR